MSEQPIPNVNDPDIRAMVLLNHEPEEIWYRWPATVRVDVYCRACWQSWPCPSITAARALDLNPEEQQP